ncbi:hypothetical protein LWI28_013743 [Acer negundo]|uniref:Uncharacterized protein n=1 Tax=Acer negundo TaxID=4023 RepID=A0AAD5IR12_ACENE|nr:hypothetical protein LWI28_013743 [Acer negundo]
METPKCGSNSSNKSSYMYHGKNSEKVFTPAKVGSFPQPRQVSCFISGLKEHVRTDLQATRPTTLSTTIGLARLYEPQELSHKRANSSTSRPTLQTRSFTGPAPNKTSLLMKKLTPEEVNERRKKGLCFCCNEKFGPGHQCKKLFTIQAVLEESDSDVEMEVEESNEEAELDTPEISLHSIAGLRAPKTMQVGGNL